MLALTRNNWKRKTAKKYRFQLFAELFVSSAVAQRMFYDKRHRPYTDWARFASTKLHAANTIIIPLITLIIFYIERIWPPLR